MKYYTGIILFATCIVLCCKPIKSQEWIWSNQIGSSGYDHATGTTDKDGNFYLAGVFGGGTCYFPSDTLVKNGNNGIFLAKFDNNGNEIWVRQFDVDRFNYNKYDGIGDIITDTYGNIYITGIFYSTAQFGSFILSANNGDVFLAKFSPDGNCEWAKKAGGTGEDGGSGLAIDSLQNVYICGSAGSVASFDSLSVAPGEFLAKYDSNGACQWSKMIVSLKSQYPIPDVMFLCMKISGDNLILGGYELAESFNIDTMVFNHPHLEGSILCSFDLSGTIRWAKEGLSPFALCGVNLSIDSFSNIYVVGEFSDSINFSGTKLFSTSRNSDRYIAKYSIDGNFIWTQKILSDIETSGGSVISDNIGDIYVTGCFKAYSVFGSDTLLSDKFSDMFLARYSSDGVCYGAYNFGTAEGMEVGLDHEGKPILTGTFENTVTIGTNTFTSYGGQDIFVAKGAVTTGSQELHKSYSNQLMIYSNPSEGKCNVKLPDDFMHEEDLTQIG